MKSKQTVKDLAILGGPPAFDRPVHVGAPNIGDPERLLARIKDMLERRWLTNNGPYVQEFERKLRDVTGAKHCIAMCNATVGLEIAIRALDMTGEVIVPSFTFIATAHALQWQQITPVFCDVDPRTHNLDPAKVERMVTPRTSGIIGVHLWGRPCDADSLAEIARTRKLKLLFDAAHAFGCSKGGKMVGNFGDAEVFSFHGTKFLNTFEGGAIATNSDELNHKIRLMTNFGFAGYDQVIYVGTNGKMNEACAAMGLTGLESLQEFISTNYRNYCQYQRELSDIPGLSMVRYDEANKCNFQYVILEIDPGISAMTRDELVKVLQAENVLARRYFYPGCHRMEPYRSHFPHAGLLLPETEKLSQRVIALPTGTGVKPDDISAIAQILRLAMTDGRAIRAALQASAPAPAPVAIH